MEGAALAAERNLERTLLVAHHGAAWTGAAYAGKLKPFASYLAQKAPPEQSGDDMLETLRALQEAGAPMNVELMN